MLDMQLSVVPGNWRLFMKRKAHPAFPSVRDKILLRDQYACQYCGFQARDYQEIVNRDQNYQNNKESNLVTSCVFCTQCLFLESIGLDETGGGTIVFLPEISQGELDSFCHVLFCAMANGTSYKESAQGIYRTIKFRSQIVEDQLGEGASDPATLGRMIMDAREAELDIPEDLLMNLRLLPSRAKFSKQIEHWAAAALAELAGESE